MSWLNKSSFKRFMSYNHFRCSLVEYESMSMMTEHELCKNSPFEGSFTPWFLSNLKVKC